MIIVAFVWISQVVILRLHDVIPITRVISRRVSIARSVQYHILRDDHAYFHDITQEHNPRGMSKTPSMAPNRSGGAECGLIACGGSSRRLRNGWKQTSHTSKK